MLDNIPLASDSFVCIRADPARLSPARYQYQSSLPDAPNNRLNSVLLSHYKQRAKPPPIPSVLQGLDVEIKMSRIESRVAALIECANEQARPTQENDMYLKKLDMLSSILEPDCDSEIMEESNRPSVSKSPAVKKQSDRILTTLLSNSSSTHFKHASTMVDLSTCTQSTNTDPDNSGVEIKALQRTIEQRDEEILRLIQKYQSRELSFDYEVFSLVSSFIMQMQAKIVNLDSCQSTIASLQNQIEQSQSKFSAAVAEKNVLLSRIENADMIAANLSKQLSTLESQNEYLRSQLSLGESNCDALKNECSTSKADALRILSELEFLRKNHNDLHAENSRIMELLSEVESRYKKSKQQNKLNFEEIVILKDSLKTEISKHHDSIRLVKDLTEKLHQVKQEMDQKESHLFEVEQMRFEMKLESLRRNYEAILADKDNELKHYLLQIENLNVQLDTSKEKKLELVHALNDAQSFAMFFFCKHEGWWIKKTRLLKSGSCKWNNCRLRISRFKMLLKSKMCS